MNVFWQVSVIESRYRRQICHLIAPTQRDAALLCLAHFYEKHKLIPAEEARLGKEFWEFQFVGAGGLIAFHPMITLHVSKHIEYSRRGESGYLESLSIYDGAELQKIVGQAEEYRQQQRLTRYAGIIQEKHTGRFRAIGGCLAATRPHARDLIARNWLGDNWGDILWELRVTEYGAMDESSGLLLEGALRGELGLD